jgi:hypothetical protein
MIVLPLRRIVTQRLIRPEFAYLQVHNPSIAGVRGLCRMKERTFLRALRLQNMYVLLRTKLHIPGFRARTSPLHRGDLR